VCVCVSVCECVCVSHFKFRKISRIFIKYLKICTTEQNKNAVTSHVLISVTTIWRTCEIVRWKRHYCPLLLRSETMFVIRLSKMTHIYKCEVFCGLQVNNGNYVTNFFRLGLQN